MSKHYDLVLDRRRIHWIVAYQECLFERRLACLLPYKKIQIELTLCDRS